MEGNKLSQKIGVICAGSPDYPALLKEIKDFPRELFYIGDIKLLRKRCAAVVGSRNTNQYGRSMAVEISKRLAGRDVAVVSGLARGIDTCAHRGALEAAGSTIAVLGCGVDICYPKENGRLKQEIEERGLVISEYALGTKPQRYHFPQRNRIISGLSEITVVVQARNNSGALITAELAAEQGREVCALPGNIDSQYNLGSNKLIKDGARPIASVADVLEAMGLDEVGQDEAEKLLGGIEMEIFRILRKHGEMSLDAICRRLEKPPSYVGGIVTVMELKGIVFSSLGKIFIAKG